MNILKKNILLIFSSIALITVISFMFANSNDVGNLPDTGSNIKLVSEPLNLDWKFTISAICPDGSGINKPIRVAYTYDEAYDGWDSWDYYPGFADATADDHLIFDMQSSGAGKAYIAFLDAEFDVDGWDGKSFEPKNVYPSEVQNLFEPVIFSLEDSNIEDTLVLFWEQDTLATGDYELTFETSAVFCGAATITNTPIPPTDTPEPTVPFVTNTPMPTHTVAPTVTVIPTITPIPIVPVWCGPLDSYNTDGEPIGDEYIEIRDFMKFRQVYNETCEDVGVDYGECGGNDTNGDDLVDLYDFSHLAKVYRKDSCTDTANPTDTPVPDLTPTITPTPVPTIVCNNAFMEDFSADAIDTDKWNIWGDDVEGAEASIDAGELLLKLPDTEESRSLILNSNQVFEGDFIATLDTSSFSGANTGTLALAFTDYDDQGAIIKRAWASIYQGEEAKYWLEGGLYNGEYTSNKVELTYNPAGGELKISRSGNKINMSYKLEDVYHGLFEIEEEVFNGVIEIYVMNLEAFPAVEAKVDNLEVSCPAIPKIYTCSDNLSDDFDDGEINTDLWNVNVSADIGSTIIESDGVIKLAMTDQSESKATGIMSKQKISGDFDIELDILGLIGTNSSSSELSVISVEDSYQARVSLLRESEDALKIQGVLIKDYPAGDDIMGENIELLDNFDLIKSRITRVGNKITLQYKIGDNEYESIVSNDDQFDGDVYIQIYSFSYESDFPAMEAEIDNFTVSCPVIDSLPETGEDEAQTKYLSILFIEIIAALGVMVVAYKYKEYKNGIS